jgi:hypothetical protein
MIVIGYPGIGKSTLADLDITYIDLESRNFWVDGKRADDWYKVYCNIAEHLSHQGYIVFTSSHEVVREQLKNSTEKVIVVYPALELKEPWLEKLWTRYKESGLEKDYMAYANALAGYTKNIQELESCDIQYKLVLRDMGYDLDEEIFNFVQEKKLYEER